MQSTHQVRQATDLRQQRDGWVPFPEKVSFFERDMQEPGGENCCGRRFCSMFLFVGGDVFRVSCAAEVDVVGFRRAGSMLYQPTAVHGAACCNCMFVVVSCRKRRG